MRKTILFFMLFLYNINYSQINPTLGIGLETLTMNKGTIDVEVLTKIIMEKQKELKKEALKRFMFKMFPDTNYTTRFYVQNCLNILLNEKNPQVIEKEVLELTTNYAIALGVTNAFIFIDNENKSKKNILSEIKVNSKSKVWATFLEKKCVKYSVKTDIANGLAKELIRFDYKKINSDLNKLNNRDKCLCKFFKKFKRKNEDFNKALKNNEYSQAQRKLRKRDNKINKIKRIAFRNNIELPEEKDNTIITTDINLSFGQYLDLVSASLSNNDKLRKKGFFKNKIDYREELVFIINEGSDKDKIMKINDKIDIYVENYEIIKNFVSDLSSDINNQETVDIILQLKENYKKQIDVKSKINDIVEKNKNVFTQETNKLNIFYTFKDHLKEFEQSKKKFNDYFKNIDNYSLQNDTDKTYNFYNDLINSYNKVVKNYNKLKEINDAEKIISADKLKPIKKELNVDNQLNKEYLDYRAKIDTTDQVKNSEFFLLQYKKGFKQVNNDFSDINFDKDLLTIDSLIDSSVKNITDNNQFFPEYINYLMTQIETRQYVIDKNNLKPEEKLKISNVISELYGKLSDLRKNKNYYNYSDVDFIENQLLKKIIEAKNLAGISSVDEETVYNDLISLTKNLTPLLKLKILSQRGLVSDSFIYDKKLLPLFEFIGNLGRLNKADTYASVIDLIRENSGKISEELPEGAFKDSYQIFVNGIKKYTLINPNAEKEYVEIDVVSFLNDLQQYYDRNNTSRFSLYLTLGLNQNFFFNKFTFPSKNGEATEEIRNIGFASEKIGVRFKILDFKKYRGYENVIKSDVYLNKKSPFINDWYVAIYGSGLLYSLANTTTNQNFNFAHAGIATGLRFYNSLDFNVVLGFPFVKNRSFPYGAFYGIGLDIPLGEYLEKLGNK